MTEFKTESKRLLELVINSIYTNREIFLRELISNASDALDKLAFAALTNGDDSISRSDLRIKLTADKNGRTLTITDNGIGMTREELEANLGTIAKSGSYDFKQEHAGDASDIIGQFGVGFYSAFMVSGEVTVTSLAYGASDGYIWSSNGVDGYTIEALPPDAEPLRGTSITLKLKDDETGEDGGEDFSQYLETYKLRSLIRKYSDYIRFPIVIDEEHTHTDADGNSHVHVEEQTLNSMTPVWQRPKSEVTDNDYKAFYRDTYYAADDPAAIINVSAEGTVSFKALLFVPLVAPVNFYTREYKPGVSLYSNGVLIMDNCADLLPACFSFVRGVVDSQDLTLNVSRETLQQDRQLRVIAKNLEKRVQSELLKLLADERETYEKFWASFGLQIKYNISADYGQKKDTLADLVLFTRARNGSEPSLVTLSEYAEAMPETQKYIYYVVAENYVTQPEVEAVLNSGFDVLALSDPSDEFMMEMLGEYKGKQLRSVKAQDLELPGDSKSDLAEQETEEKELLDFLTKTLSPEVSAVKLTSKLVSAPCALSSGGNISLEMERFLKTVAGGESFGGKALRILELNPVHKAFGTLKTLFAEDKDKAAQTIKLLYLRAQLAAGLELSGAEDYTKLLDDVVSG
ncbi:MAG: molecular chaperone HtpG [Oscillospiraceae bacterium]|jgi:molecular chaperone HtpG|nr:molecular chaperone HtpG [Oscillospiraceae bacterium]